MALLLLPAGKYPGIIHSIPINNVLNRLFVKDLTHNFVLVSLVHTLWIKDDKIRVRSLFRKLMFELSNIMYFRHLHYNIMNNSILALL